MGILTIEEALKRERNGEGKVTELNDKNYFCETGVATIYTLIGVDLNNYKPIYQFNSQD